MANLQRMAIFKFCVTTGLSQYHSTCWKLVMICQYVPCCQAPQWKAREAVFAVPMERCFEADRKFMWYIYIYIADMHLLHRKSRNQTKKCSCYIQVTSAPCFFTFLHLGSEGADAKRLAAKQETLGSLMNPQGTRMDASENPVVHVVYWCASHMFWMYVLSVSGNLCWLCTLAHRPNAEGAKGESRNMRKFMSVFYS